MYIGFTRGHVKCEKEGKYFRRAPLLPLAMRIRTHVPSEGRLVEDMENKIRNTLNEIYFGKTKDIVNGLRSVQPLAEANSQVVLQVT